MAIYIALTGQEPG